MPAATAKRTSVGWARWVRQATIAVATIPVRRTAPAETGSQALLIAAVGGASSAGLGVPMLFAFVIGLLMSNFAIVLFSSVGFVSSQARERVYVGIGAVAGVFSLAIGVVFMFGQDAVLPDLGTFLPF